MLRRGFVSTLGAAFAAPAIVRAETWPNRQIKVVIPYPPKSVEVLLNADCFELGK